MILLLLADGVSKLVNLHVMITTGKKQLHTDGPVKGRRKDGLEEARRKDKRVGNHLFLRR